MSDKGSKRWWLVDDAYATGFYSVRYTEAEAEAAREAGEKPIEVIPADLGQDLARAASFLLGQDESGDLTAKQFQERYAECENTLARYEREVSA